MNHKYLLLSGFLIFSANVFSMETFNLKQLLTASIHRVTNTMNQSLYTEEIEAKPQWFEKEAEKRNVLKKELMKLFPVKNTNFVAKYYNNVVQESLIPMYFDKLLEEVQNNPKYLYQFIYTGRDDDLKEILLQMQAYKSLYRLHNAQQDANKLKTLKESTQEFILLNSTKYSPLAIAITSKENLESKIKILNMLNIEPTKDDKLLSKLDFYEHTPELTRRNVILCAIFKNCSEGTQKTLAKNHDDLPDLNLQEALILKIISYLKYDDYKDQNGNTTKSPIIPFDSFFDSANIV